MDKKNDMQYQVELLERAKTELDMSQSDISRKFEVGTSSVSNWAKQKIKMPTSIKIALELMIKDKENQNIIDTVKAYHQIMDKIVKK